MKYTFVIFIILQILTAPVAKYHGTLMYLKAGSSVSVDDLWLNESRSDSTDLYRHRVPLELLLNDDEYFRSPLIEQWEDLEVTWAELNLYNVEGGLMAKYHFEGPYPGVLVVEFFQTEFLRDKTNTEATANLTYGPSVYVHKEGNKAYFSFMAIQMAVNNTSMRGSQFMVSVDNIFNYLGEADHYSCAHIPLFGDIIDVTAVFQCTYHCLTVLGCVYYGIYTSSTSTDTRHRCVPLLGQPADTRQDCDIVCPDNRPCGREYKDLQSLDSASADVYSMVPEVHNDLMAMQRDNITTESNTYYINAQSSIDLGSKIFVGGINVRGPGTYMLLIYGKPCEHLFDENLQGQEDLYHGYHVGSIKVFKTDTKHTFAPVLARCLYFNTTVDLQGRIAEVSKVTNKFLLADYLTVQVEWNKEFEAACTVMEVMSRKDFIPDTAIEISQSRSLKMDFANGNTYNISCESYCIIEIDLPMNFTEPWIEHLAMLASENVAVTIEVHSHRKCTNQTNGKIYTVYLYEEVEMTADANMLTNETFDQLKFDDNPTFCADSFTVIITSLSQHLTFEFSLQLYGCVIDPGATVAYECQTRNLLDSYDAEIIGWLEHRPMFAYNALRSDGRGLMLTDIDNDVTVTIQLSQLSPVELRRVVLTGSLTSAFVDNGEELRIGNINDGYPIEINYIGVLAHNLTIFDIQRDDAIGQPYLNLTVAIYVCVITNGSSNALPDTIAPSPSKEPKVNPIPSSSATQETTTPPPDTTDSLQAGSVLTHLDNISNVVTTSYSEVSTSEKTAQINPSRTVETWSEEINTPDMMTILSTVSYSRTTTSHQTTVLSNESFTGLQSVFKILPTPQFTLPQYSTNIFPDKPSSQLNILSQFSTTAFLDDTPAFPRKTEMLSSTDTSPHITIYPQSGDTVGFSKPVTEGTEGSGTGTSETTDVTTQTTRKAEETTKHNVHTEACRCFNQARNLTLEELDVIVEELVRNLTIPVERTAMFRRSKMSMPDKRQSSTVIGGVGIACMVAVAGVIVIMDIDHILKALNFVKSVLSIKLK